MTERPKVAKTRRVQRLMLKLRWNCGAGFRYRLWSLASGRYPWWDWGHWLMILVGMNDCGNWSAPSPPTWWYTVDTDRRMWRTNYPRRTCRVVKSYDEFRKLTAGLNEDGMYEWRAMNGNQDGEIQFGRRYWGGDFYGLDYAETRLAAKYLRMWRRLDWWGARSWVYSQALHAAVHRRKPRSCAQVPPKGSGGYDHWHCQLKRGHEGVHRFESMEWGHVVAGEPIGVVMPRLKETS